MTCNPQGKLSVCTDVCTHCPTVNAQRLFCMCWVHSLSDSQSLYGLTCMCLVYLLTDSLSLRRLACVECTQCLTIITWEDLFACVEYTHWPTLRTWGDLLACVGKDHDRALLIGLCIFVQDVHKVSILDICRHQDIVLLQTLNGGNPAE